MVKTSYLDFLLSGSAITFLVGAALGLNWLLGPWLKTVFGDYYVIAGFFLVLLAYGLLSALLVRLLLRFRPIPPGVYGADSPVFTYWKLVTVVYRLGQGALLPFTNEFNRPLVVALFGGRIGANVAIGATIDDPYQVTVGEGAVLGHNAMISGNVLFGGKLTCGTVRIGARVTVGVNSVVLPGTEIGDDAVLMGGSYLMPGTTIPAGETWRGNPARKWV